MTRPSDAELDRLRIIAEEVCEVMAGEGFTVDGAANQHKAFKRTRATVSTLEQNLVISAAERGARIAGMHPDATGTGLDIKSWDDGFARRYRPKKAEVTAAGEDRMVCGAGSSLLKSGDEDMMWIEESWVLGYRLNDDHTVVDFFAAEIIGHEENAAGPVHLKLGTHYSLMPTPAPLGFVSSDEELDLGDTDEEGQREVG